VKDTEAFPPGFTFGVATSAYQVEGGIENDWSAWERAGKCKEPDARCGPSVEHWERFFDDIALIQRLGATAYRLSIEWARVEPQRGVWDESAWAGYRDRLLALRAAGITPMVTLLHFTHPPWFHAETPWHESSSLVAWTRFVNKCAEMLQGLAVKVTTLNEPNVMLLGGYLAGVMPPGIADGRKAFAAMANLVRAHVIARHAILEKCPTTEFAIAQNMLLFAPSSRWSPLDHALARLADGNYNHAFLEALQTGVLKIQMPGFTAGREVIDGAAKSTEFIGLNYYTRAHLGFVTKAPFVQFEFLDRHSRGLTDIGWEWYPEGFGQILRQLKRYALPVWITENGLDDRSGKRRVNYLFEHWREMLLAMADGVDVRGYLHWSLMDNFEWLEAWGPRFGLYRVDRATMERQWTPACDYFHQVATSGRLSEPTSKAGA
jgi:beta-glucosidase